VLPDVLRTNPDFRKAFLGDLTSSLGTAMSVIAFPLLVLSIGGSAVEAGSIGTVSLGTQLGFRLPAGYFADRWNRRTLMVTTDVVRLVALGSIPVVALAGRLEFPQLIVVASVEGLASALFKPAGDVLIKDVVSEGDLAGALGLGQSVLASSYLVGPAMGGILFAANHVLPFAVDAASYGISAVLLLSMTSRPPRPVPAEADGSGGVMAGARWLVRQRTLFSVLAYASVLNLVVAVLEVVVILEMHGLGRPGGQIGLILSCCGVGAVVGSLLSSHIVKRVSMPVILLGIGVAWSLVLLVFAFFVSAWLTAALLTMLMTLSPAAGVTVGQALISGTPRELLGRVNAVTGIMLSGLAALGPFAAGALFQALGTTGSWLTLAALTLAVTALGWLPLRAAGSLTSAPGLGWRASASARI
jgi:MFS family permease